MAYPMLQQYLPFTVLKLRKISNNGFGSYVATVLTVYGIETKPVHTLTPIFNRVATVLTVYGIETAFSTVQSKNVGLLVATVLTVYGIETCTH